MEIPSVSSIFQARVGAIPGFTSVASALPGGSFAAQYASALDSTDGAESFFNMNIEPAAEQTPAQAQTQTQQAGWTPPQATYSAAVTNRASSSTPLYIKGGSANDPMKTVSGSGLADRVVSFAEQYVGLAYVWGGEDLEKGVDCSGFSQAVYNHFGVKLPRSAYRQSMMGTKVDSSDMSNLKPGDLLFFKYDDHAPVTHVAMYVGDGKVIQAAGKDYGVIISNLKSNWQKCLVTVQRIVP